MNLMVGGVSKLSVRNDGLLSLTGGKFNTATMAMDNFGRTITNLSGGGNFEAIAGGQGTAPNGGAELFVMGPTAATLPGGWGFVSNGSVFTANNSANPPTTIPYVMTVSSMGFVMLSTGTFIPDPTSRFDIIVATAATSIQAGLESYAMKIATYTNTGAAYEVGITTAGHFTALSDSPTISGCGTGPTGKWTDQWGWITPGSGATGCVITFAAPYKTRPVCVVAPETESLVTGFTYTVSNTAVTVSSLGSGGIFDYKCAGIGE
jgi:hypothetical protein